VTRSGARAVVGTTLLAASCLPPSSPGAAERPCDRELIANEIMRRRVPRRAVPKPAERAPRTAPSFSVATLPLYAGRVAAEAYPAIAPREAPALDRAELLCEVLVRAPRGLDSVRIGPARRLDFTPDLRVRASFGGVPHDGRVAPNQTRAVFAFRPKLSVGDDVTFVATDPDLFGPDDPIGRLGGRYPGRLPFVLSNEALRVECRGRSDAERERARGAALGALEAELASFARHRATLDAPLPEGWHERLVARMAEVAFHGAEGDPELAAARARVEAVLRTHWGRYLAEIDRAGRELPPPGTWVALGAAAEVRVAGLLCQGGDGLPPRCNVELEARLRSPGSLCPVDLNRAGPVTDLEAYFYDGKRTRLSVFNVLRGGALVPHERELARVAPGAVYSLELTTDRFVPSPRSDENEWQVPLIRVGGRFLRVY
jgi:hypothetical protein